VPSAEASGGEANGSSVGFGEPTQRSDSGKACGGIEQHWSHKNANVARTYHIIVALEQLNVKVNSL
jgi:hypothetical protein